MMKEQLIKKSKAMNDINAESLLGNLLFQLYWCSESARKTGEITQENLGRILVVNNILIEYYKMSWEETKDLFLEYGLKTDIIK